MIVRRTEFDRVRIYHTLRSAHLERARTLPPSSILYRAQRYDFDPELAAGLDLIGVGALRMALVLARSRVRWVEINEPLMSAGIRRTVVALGALQFSCRVRRRRLTVVSYAIENRDPRADRPSPSVRRRATGRIDGFLSRLSARRIDKIAYGTTAAQSLYRVLLGRELASAESVVIPALPSPCTDVTEPEQEPHLVLFLGALVARKGFDRLLAAWPTVASMDPDIHLQVVGKGDMEPSAHEMAEFDTGVSLAVDPPRREIHRHLARARCLVLLSQPTPRWREQVGLPIVEGLAHGCVIVTTTETGLAQWLSEHGHRVLAPDAEAADIAGAIVEAVRHGPPRRQIRATLPRVDGRLAADAWLFGDEILDSDQDRTNGFNGSATLPIEE